MISIVQKNLIVDHKCLLYGYVFFELFMQEFSFGVLDHLENQNCSLYKPIYTPQLVA